MTRYAVVREDVGGPVVCHFGPVRNVRQPDGSVVGDVELHPGHAGRQRDPGRWRLDGRPVAETTGGSVVIEFFAWMAIVWCCFGLAHILVYGVPDWASVGPRFKAWRIRRAWEAEVSAKALDLLAENPHLPYKCDNWPKYKMLCGQCCAYSRADTALRADREAVNKLIREVVS